MATAGPSLHLTSASYEWCITLQPWWMYTLTESPDSFSSANGGGAGTGAGGVGRLYGSYRWMVRSDVASDSGGTPQSSHDSGTPNGSASVPPPSTTNPTASPASLPAPAVSPGSTPSADRVSYARERVASSWCSFLGRREVC